MQDIKRTFCGEVELSHAMVKDLATKYQNLHTEEDLDLLGWEIVVPIINKVHEMIKRSERNAIYTIIDDFASQLKLDNEARQALIDLAEDRIDLLTE